jgi:DNA-binding MarR family transcriptional regulator
MSDDLRTAARSLALLARKLERACGGLSLAQYRVLLALSAAGDERSSLVAERLAVAKPTITAIVDRLVERGLVAREAIEGDRRSIRLRVTDAGVAALGDAEDEMVLALETMLVDVRDRDALLRALGDLHDAWTARLGAKLEAPRP